VWNYFSAQVLLCQNKNDSARLQQLREQLQFGDQLTAEEQEPDATEPRRCVCVV